MASRGGKAGPVVSITNGIVRAMTRSAEMRATASGEQPDAGLSLIDKLNLLQMVAEHSSADLQGLLSEVRQHRQGDAAAVFGSVKAFIDARNGEGG